MENKPKNTHAYIGTPTPDTPLMRALSFLRISMPNKQEQRTAVYYIGSLFIMVSLLCLVQIFQHSDAPRDAIFAATFSSYCNLAMHCSGILFGIAISRMDQAEKEEAARAESLKENLI